MPYMRPLGMVITDANILASSEMAQRSIHSIQSQSLDADGDGEEDAVGDADVESVNDEKEEAGNTMALLSEARVNSPEEVLAMGEALANGYRAAAFSGTDVRVTQLGSAYATGDVAELVHQDHGFVVGPKGKKTPFHLYYNPTNVKLIDDGTPWGKNQVYIFQIEAMTFGFQDASRKDSIRCAKELSQLIQQLFVCHPISSAQPRYACDVCGCHFFTKCDYMMHMASSFAGDIEQCKLIESIPKHSRWTVNFASIYVMDYGHLQILRGTVASSLNGGWGQGTPPLRYDLLDRRGHPLMNDRCLDLQSKKSVRLKEHRMVNVNKSASLRDLYYMIRTCHLKENGDRFYTRTPTPPILPFMSFMLPFERFPSGAPGTMEFETHTPICTEPILKWQIDKSESDSEGSGGEDEDERKPSALKKRKPGKNKDKGAKRRNGRNVT